MKVPISQELGIPIADEKWVGPVTVLTFLGFEIDTEEMVIRIPQEKLEALKADLIFYSKQKRITLKKNLTVPFWFFKPFLEKRYDVLVLLTGVFMTLQ